MIFLTQTDIELTIGTYSLSQITENQNLINFSEKLAIEEVKSYLTSRYDVDYDFRPYSNYNSQITYDKDDRIILNNLFYVSKSDNNFNNSPTVSNNFWEQKDDRPTQLVVSVLDIMIFHLSTSVDFSSVSEIRRQRYLDTIKKLQELTKGKNTLIGGTLRKNNVGNSIAWGSKGNDNYDINETSTTSRKDLSVTIFSTTNNSFGQNPFFEQ